MYGGVLIYTVDLRIFWKVVINKRDVAGGW